MTFQDMERHDFSGEQTFTFLISLEMSSAPVRMPWGSTQEPQTEFCASNYVSKDLDQFTRTKECCNLLWGLFLGKKYLNGVFFCSRHSLLCA